MGSGQRLTGRGPGDELLGRAEECARLDGAVEALRSGAGGVLVLRGDAGAGKSALLSYAGARAQDCRVLRVRGVQSETGLPFAALHQLCHPLTSRVAGLPDLQRAALDRVFGLHGGPMPEMFLIGVSVLSLLSDASRDLPVLCLVDDVDWLDRESAQVLGFVARRLEGEAVGVVVTARDPGPELSRLPELEIRGLGENASRALLDAATPARLDVSIGDRVITEARGNPGALAELGRGLSVTQLASGLGLLDADPAPDRSEHELLAEIRSLTEPTRLLLLVAAAEPSGDPRLVHDALAHLGLDNQPALLDQAQGLVTIDGRVTFRGLRVRSAAYRAATAEHRRAAHDALATVTSPTVHAERHAWHRAAASVVPDESVARQLEQSARASQARGDLAVAAAFLQRSVSLTGDDARRPQRALAAAAASLTAGDLDAARTFLDIAERRVEDHVQRVRCELVRARLALASDRPRNAGPLLLDAATQLESLDLPLARATYLDAWGAAVAAGDRSLLAGVSAALRRLPESGQQPGDRLLRGYSLLSSGDRPRAVPILRRAAGEIATLTSEEVRGLGWAASAVGPAIWDADLFRSSCRTQVELSREAGALTDLVRHLTALALTTAWSGDLAAADRLIGEAEVVARDTGSPAGPTAALLVAALRGSEGRARTLISATVDRARVSGRGGGVTAADWSKAVLYNGLAQYESALLSARAASSAPQPWVSVWALPELLEAAARLGDDEAAQRALADFAAATEPCRTDWALGLTARCRAVVGGSDQADDLFTEALQRLGRSGWRPEVARAHLLYGEWLRREGRRVDARRQLRAAHEQFESIGMEAFAERAGRELLATGETARRRADSAPPTTELTPQELQISLLVSDGLSNTEVGARLFLSPRTVEWHLRKVFAKLSISSRRQLPEALPDGSSPELIARERRPAGVASRC